MTSTDLSFLDNGGEMGALMRSVDWAKTPVGEISGWPSSLRTVVGLLLQCAHPMFVFWGPELVQFYNDAYRPILGATKHPDAMGQRGADCFKEIMHVLSPMFEQVFGGGSTFTKDGLLVLDRNGFLEEGYYDYGFSPIRGAQRTVEGILAVCSETTGRVIGERRMGVLREVSARPALEKTLAGAFGAVETVLTNAPRDLPFALLYVITGQTATLVSCAGLARDTQFAPVTLQLERDSRWPLGEVFRSGAERLVEGFTLPSAGLTAAAWPEPISRALVLPLTTGGGFDAVLVAGISPRLQLGEDYRSFLQLLAQQLGATLSRTQAFEQQRLHAEELKELDRAKTAFFSNVSHEFRTPLTLILGPVEDALAREAPSLSGEELGLVRRNVLRLYKMVNGLLDFSRSEAGKEQATFAPTDLSSLTRSLVSFFETAIQRADLALVVDCEKLPQPVFVDPALWEKIVLNLVSNALKYTERGEIRVKLQWQDGSAVLTVQDTGVGIPAEELPRVFERFYRVRATEGRSHEGTGIGLALVQELVKLHGGSVHVESTFGKGTTFRVALRSGSAHLPADRVALSAGERSSFASAAAFVEEAGRWSSADLRPVALPTVGAGVAEPQGVSSVQAARILVVDDNADLRGYVAGLLEKFFTQVERAANGADALEQIRSRPPDLVISDVMMPKLDGFGLVQALRADPRTRAVPVILLSARAGDESAVEGLQSGADDYLAKPFSARELLARVRTQLEMVRVRRDVFRAEVLADELRESVRVRDEFLSIASHELRTPLTSLDVQLETLERRASSLAKNEEAEDWLKKRVGMVRRQGDRLARLATQLLDVSREKDGGAVLRLEAVDLSEVTRTVVADLMEGVIVRANCELGARLGDGVIGRWDRAKLEQVVTNLLINACKFGAGKPITVVSRVDKNAAILEVGDEGVGIAPEHHERIFGRFERAASERHYGGLGLGLYITRQVVRALGGTIQVESSLGAGAMFTVSLPLEGPPPNR